MKNLKQRFKQLQWATKILNFCALSYKLTIPAKTAVDKSIQFLSTKSNQEIEA